MYSNFQMAKPNLDDFRAFSLSLEIAIANGDTANAEITFHVYKGTGIQELVGKTIRRVIAENCHTWDDFSQVKHEIATLTRSQLDITPLVIRQLEKMTGEQYPLIIEPDDILIREQEEIAA